MEQLGRGREILACFTALVCAVLGYRHRCIIVKKNYLDPAKLSRVLDGVDNRATCMFTCLNRDQCKGVYHDKRTRTCGHYDNDLVFFGREPNPRDDIAMVHCSTSALKVVPIFNGQVQPSNIYGSVVKACLIIGGKRLAKEDELVVLLSQGAWYRWGGWIHGKKLRFLKHSSQPGKLKICDWTTNVGFCVL